MRYNPEDLPLYIERGNTLRARAVHAAVIRLGRALFGRRNLPAGENLKEAEWRGER